MPRKSTTRGAQGGGSIRLRADGTWKARFTLGRDPGTGKQILKSVYGKTQGAWVDVWLEEYTGYPRAPA